MVHCGAAAGKNFTDGSSGGDIESIDPWIEYTGAPYAGLLSGCAGGGGGLSILLYPLAERAKGRQIPAPERAIPLDDPQGIGL